MENIIIKIFPKTLDFIIKKGYNTISKYKLTEEWEQIPLFGYV